MLRVNENSTNVNFRGTPQRLQQGVIRDYHDALRVWEQLRNAKYLDVHSDKTSPYNKVIRQNNYSFLDKLITIFDKSQFIQRFCEFTKFPNLALISQNIDTTFRSCIQNISANLNSHCYNGNPYGIIDTGYDTTCSLGIKKAFPGSDLDKGYIIIEGNHPYLSDETLVNEVKGQLWFNLDQRIASLNHPDTYPDVYTRSQILSMLDKLNFTTYKLFIRETMGKNFSIFRMLVSTIFQTFNIEQKYSDAVNNPEIEPFNAAVLNRAIARILPVDEREDAKNFAFFIETVLSNLRKYPMGKTDELFSKIKTSIFAKKSNVTQNSAWQDRINKGYLKSKLRRREQLERDFAGMDIDTKYELIKDVIKSSSNDEGTRFAQFFKNDDNISDRYQRLLESLR